MGLRRLTLVLGGMSALSYLVLLALVLCGGGGVFGADVAPDLRVLGYDPDALRAFFEGQTEAERAVYFGAIWVADTIFPVLFSAFLALCLWQLAGLLTCALAALYLLFDLSENAVVRWAWGAEDFDRLAGWASAMTQLKFAALGASALVMMRALYRLRQGSSE